MSDNSCCCTDKNVIILACSGSSNVGQIANQAAIDLTREGQGSFFCLAGMGAGLSGFVRSAMDADEMVVIDGCPIACAKCIFERNNVPLRNHLVVTELGIEKVKRFDVDQEDVEKVKDAAKRLLQGKDNLTSDEIKTDVPCCGKSQNPPRE